ncbi:hypothetical protein B0T17DRAFT_88988 [Bombardia bombarda]|uniref:BTB domain-containing protein n=1 Tax=Bombardia bombarda TaxID=252184 RepID=A0AA40CFC9_9PEZI|nr:hypothetical protein B0T17DRAFT_88988 [Bombardia bombarda]
MTTTRCLTGSEPPVTAIDPEGDLLLYVGKGAHQKIFKVDTCALRRVSPIWNDMLFGGDRKESMSANGERVLRLPSDQPEPMKMVMDIIHTNFTAIPKRLDLEPLYDLLTTTRKYEMIQILRPFAPTWMDAVPQSTWSGDWESAQQLIFTTCIAYELGDEDRVQAQFEILCMKTGIDEDNNSLMLGDICIGDDESLSPQDFFGKRPCPLGFLLWSLFADWKSRVDCRGTSRDY